MKKIIFYAVVLLPFLGFSQTAQDTTATELNEVVVSNKVPKKYTQLPNQVEVITAKQIDFQNFQSTAEMLSNSGSLFVQKSQQGGGSPVIRGFEASRVLITVDGVRMNNLIFRAGHLQNVITVDENMLENVGVFYGPSSTLFGSDALGGAVAMTTKDAKFLDQAHNKFTGGVNTRYSSVNEEKSAALYLNYATSKFASMTFFSFNDFGDLKMGKERNHNGDYFGERPNYVSTVGGVDQLNVNSDQYTQVGSAYKQYNFMQKFAYKTNSGYLHGLNLQYSTTSDINRYDRLTETAGSGLRFAQWYYGPQDRLLAIYSLQKEKAFLNSDLKINVVYQNVKESRHNRRFGNYNLQHNEENVDMFSVSLDLDKKFTKGELFYGFESYYETLKSTAYANNINTGVVTDINTRYPNGDNNMMRNDLYVSYNEKMSDKTFWNVGARAGYTTLKSTIADNAVFPLPFSDISQGNFTYSGTLGITHNTSKNFALKGNIATGFRAPNIDDLAKVFESRAGSSSSLGILIVPNEDLKPEKTITGDLGIVIQSDSKKIKLESTYFYTRMYDAIVTDDFTYNGQSIINYNGFDAQVKANQNKGKAFVTGFSTNVSAYIISDLLFSANFNYTLGRVVEEGSQRPLDHIAPYFGKVGLSYTHNKLNLEGYMLYNGKKDIQDYSTSGEDNAQYAPANGMPAWETYNFKAGFQVLKGGTLFAGVENILDTQYRVFASGINAPGRNIYGGIKYTF
ncbi:MAG: TonB-dependent receptor [Flavobacterium sp.]|uniref:TonB-dependent receptor plug domain-containing protein n=1 Tax=Flavobacterium sp. TaxID=239 RepID=UPI0025B9CC69|nr:TonB-dependent receptor [Flavobacterium sp.]MCA1965085.1 TonB-dependent receptor [Flavobacterium sp.]